MYSQIQQMYSAVVDTMVADRGYWQACSCTFTAEITGVHTPGGPRHALVGSAAVCNSTVLPSKHLPLLFVTLVRQSPQHCPCVQNTYTVKFACQQALLQPPAGGTAICLPQLSGLASPHGMAWLIGTASLGISSGCHRTLVASIQLLWYIGRFCVTCMYNLNLSCPWSDFLHCSQIAAIALLLLLLLLGMPFQTPHACYVHKQPPTDLLPVHNGMNHPCITSSKRGCSGSGGATACPV